MKSIYLDYAAATPIDPKVLQAMQPYFIDRFYNPSASYLVAKAVNQDIQNARASVAKWLGCRPSEVVFTAGGTEANNLAINGIMQAYPGHNLLVSAIEHDSVLKSAAQHKFKPLRVSGEGVIDLKDLTDKIDDKTVLVSVMYASNEIGTVEPLRQIGQLLAQIRRARQRRNVTTPLYFHTDACQAAAYLDLHIDKLGVDLMTINGGKIYGPKQSGALYIKTGTKIRPQILGGGQENGMRSGTENTAAIIGLSTALDLVQSRRKQESNRLAKLHALFISELSRQIPTALINGSLKHRLPNNLNITLPGEDNERLMMMLDEKDIICAVGSACSASSEEPSHVLKAIGLSDQAAQASLRFSFGRQTKEPDIKRTVTELKGCLR